MSWFEEIWDSIVDGFNYFISFEWIGDIGEGLSGLFSNLGEFSTTGLVFGLISGLFIFLTRDYMLNTFLDNMGAVQSIIWGGLTYAGCIFAGYLIGKNMFDS